MKIQEELLGNRIPFKLQTCRASLCALRGDEMPLMQRKSLHKKRRKINCFEKMASQNGGLSG